MYEWIYVWDQNTKLVHGSGRMGRCRHHSDEKHHLSHEHGIVEQLLARMSADVMHALSCHRLWLFEKTWLPVISMHGKGGRTHSVDTVGSCSRR